jgi:uncharacterized protein (UPF0261 family)
MATVVLLGTLDTKGDEYSFLRERIQAQGCDVVMVDTGVLGEPRIPADVSRVEVATAANSSIENLIVAKDRGAAMEAMAKGAATIARQLHAAGRLDGVIGLGGSGGSSVATYAMRALPVGVPKLMVSTLASGDTRPYVGESDICMMYSVVDIAGINRISERIIGNAAAAIAGMAKASASFKPHAVAKPLVGATMFGVTTPCVTKAREVLEQRGYEVLVFHATGAGGRSMERLMQDGFITAALDITTTELADELVGGVLSAGPDRLEMAGKLGIPQVVSLGALDMVNFGPMDTVPERFKGRTLYKHNPTVTLMRTTSQECAELGRMIARKLNQAKGPLSVFIPLRGVSMIDKEGGVFRDAEADRQLFDVLQATLDPTVEVIALDTDINDPAFAIAMAEKLDQFYQSWSQRHQEVKHETS